MVGLIFVFRRGEPVVIKRAMRPRINEVQLLGWKDEQCDKAMSTTTYEILKRAKMMATPTTEGEAAKMSAGLKLWRLFKNWNPVLKERAAKLRESACRSEVDNRGLEWFFL